MPGRECWIPTDSVAVTIQPPANLYGTPYSADQHLPSPSNAGQGHVDAPSVAVMVAAGLCSLPEARPTGSAGDQGKPRCRWLDGSPPHHLHDEPQTSNLFGLMFSAMLMDAYRDEHPGIRIAYRTDGHLLNSRSMQAPTRVPTTTVHHLLFADDCALNTVTEEDM
ncbi:unnamed protein product [Schistocephalus solidus]|uniref:Reverse transcriptase domain-containing protein n=1 Tax=Schistocephalus solidus TaxID=70667 RepID=A0A183SP04_SCHSO|nr:unnamed protein product [Schistocephalus solidus]